MQLGTFALGKDECLETYLDKYEMSDTGHSWKKSFIIKSPGYYTVILCS